MRRAGLAPRLLRAAALWALCAFAALALGDQRAFADGADDESFRNAAEALRLRQHAAAIVELEGLADRGVLHPDVSYNRGLAYALRAKSADAEPGDLGRAAAAFEEARMMRPLDKEAEEALDLVRAEVARRRSKQDKDDVIVRPSLDRVVLTLLSPAAWTFAALAASLLLGVGLLMRWRPSGWVHVAGAVLAPLAAALLVALAPLAYFAREIAATKKPGVVVIPEANLETDEGKASEAPSIPEATLVEIGDRHDDEVLVRWGNYEGWLPSRAVRTVATP